MVDQVSASLPASFGLSGFGSSTTGPTGSGIVATDIITNFTTGTATNLDIKSIADSKPVRINSRNYTQTTGTAIGFQCKPAQTVSGQSVTGCEISPRANSGVALTGTIIGAHIDAFLKGTAAGTVGGDVRALNLELVTDDAGVRAVTGNVNFIRMRAAFSASISGVFAPIRIEKAETQTGSAQYGAIIDLPSTLGTGATTIWTDAGVSSATNAGCLAVLVNGNKRYINLFSGTPS